MIKSEERITAEKNKILKIKQETVQKIKQYRQTTRRNSAMTKHHEEREDT